MNTRDAYKIRRERAAAQRYRSAPVGLARSRRRAGGMLPGASARAQVDAPAAASTAAAAASAPQVDAPVVCETLPERSCRHPLADLRANAELAHCEEAITGRFDAIVPALKKLSAMQHEADFEARAQALAHNELGYALPEEVLRNAWINGLDVRRLYAHCTFEALRASVAQFSENLRAQADRGLDAQNFLLECGFHSVNISPCADGRLKGFLKYVLRLPLTALAVRKAYAGALFDVEEDIAHWQSVELARYREGYPTPPEAGSRYLKIAVYHTSSSDPEHQGCAAHGSDERKAAEAALQRLVEFREAIENSFCCGASVDILLIGVDTDTDAIRIHVPDARGEMALDRFVDNAALYRDTLHLDADRARVAVHAAVEAAAGEAGAPHEGMRRFIARLLINNISQIEYVSDLYGGRYPDIGHAERYISVGDGFEEVQLRNLAYYAHLDTVEEGAADLDVGIRIFSKLNLSKGLPIPIAIHYRYDLKVPGSRQRMAEKCRRVRDAIMARYPQLARRNDIICQMSLQDRTLGSPVEVLQEDVA